MKSIRLLKQLRENPHYTLTAEELKVLADAETTGETSQKKVSSRGNAAVKETGKLDKHPSDPVEV